MKGGKIQYEVGTLQFLSSHIYMEISIGGDWNYGTHFPSFIANIVENIITAQNEVFRDSAVLQAHSFDLT